MYRCRDDSVDSYKDVFCFNFTVISLYTGSLNLLMNKNKNHLKDPMCSEGRSFPSGRTS